jgi:hypothetical protein
MGQWERAKVSARCLVEQAKFMNFDHVVELVLLGWYLIVPPINHSWSNDVWHWFNSSVPIVNKCNPDAPLSEWQESGEYERLSECQTDQEKAPDDTRKIIEDLDQETIGDAPSKEEKAADDEEIRCAYHARCVASDDPRLAK